MLKPINNLFEVDAVYPTIRLEPINDSFSVKPIEPLPFVDAQVTYQPVDNLNIPDLKFPLETTSFYPIQTLTFEDEKTISSQVFDDLGNILPGASIHLVNDISKGVTSDFNGNFSLQVKLKDVLEFRFIGYETKRIPISELGNSVVMQESSENLNEVIIYANPAPSSVINNDTTKAPTKKKDYIVPVAIGITAFTLVALLLGSKKKETNKAGLGAAEVTI